MNQTSDFLEVARGVASTQYNFSVERRAVFQVLTVRTSVRLSNISHGFNGMWLGSLTVPDVGCIPGHHSVSHVPG